jgi:hypothetical protein
MVEAYSTDFDSHADYCPRDAFRNVWRWLHGHDAWDINPVVLVIAFDVLKANIDALPQARAA